MAHRKLHEKSTLKHESMGGTKPQWVMAAASATGKSHLETDTPCQDAWITRQLNSGWGIAIVADGAGSYSHTHLGSAYASEKCAEIFTKLLGKERWFHREEIPSGKAWRTLALAGLQELNGKMINLANELGVTPQAVSTTLILVIYHKQGLLFAQIGDGRGAVRFKGSKWESFFTPCTGEQAGMTVFLTTDFIWKDPEQYIQTGTFQKELDSYAILTDGMERHCFYCYIKCPETGKYYDPNLPFEPFFDQNTRAIQGLYSKGKSQEEINTIFQSYLHDGTPSIANESDDKTMILVTKNREEADAV